MREVVGLLSDVPLKRDFCLSKNQIPPSPSPHFYLDTYNNICSILLTGGIVFFALVEIEDDKIDNLSLQV